MRGHAYDALVGLAGCDKSLPGMLMAMARLDVPSVFVYGGTIMPGRFRERDVTIQDAFEAAGAFAAGTIDAQELHAVECAVCPGAGACGGQYTANTMGLRRRGDRDGAPRLLLAPRRGPRRLARRAPRPGGGGGDERPPERHPAFADPHDEGPGERHRDRRRHRRLDQRRPPPPRDRPRARPVAHPRRRGARLRPHPHPRGPPPRRPVRHARPSPRRRRARRPEGDAGGGRAPRRLPDDHRPHAGGGACRRRDPHGPGRGPGRGTTTSIRTAASRSCAATSRPRAAS